MKRPRIIERCLVCCCGIDKQFRFKHEAAGWLLGHIRKKHKPLLITIEKRAMKRARSQNGLGYFDHNGNGWKKANKEFKDSWRKSAVLSMCKEYL